MNIFVKKKLCGILFLAYDSFSPAEGVTPVVPIYWYFFRGR